MIFLLELLFSLLVASSVFFFLIFFFLSDKKRPPPPPPAAAAAAAAAATAAAAANSPANAASARTAATGSSTPISASPMQAPGAAAGSIDGKKNASTVAASGKTCDLPFLSPVAVGADETVSGADFAWLQHLLSFVCAVHMTRCSSSNGNNYGSGGSLDHVASDFCGDVIAAALEAALSHPSLQHSSRFISRLELVDSTVPWAAPSSSSSSSNSGTTQLLPQIVGPVRSTFRHVLASTSGLGEDDDPIVAETVVSFAHVRLDIACAIELQGEVFPLAALALPQQQQQQNHHVPPHRSNTSSQQQHHYHHHHHLHQHSDARESLSRQSSNSAGFLSSSAADLLGDVVDDDDDDDDRMMRDCSDEQIQYSSHHHAAHDADDNRDHHVGSGDERFLDFEETMRKQHEPPPRTAAESLAERRADERRRRNVIAAIPLQLLAVAFAARVTRITIAAPLRLCLQTRRGGAVTVHVTVLPFEPEQDDVQQRTETASLEDSQSERLHHVGIEFSALIGEQSQMQIAIRKQVRQALVDAAQFLFRERVCGKEFAGSVFG